MSTPRPVGHGLGNAIISIWGWFVLGAWLVLICPLMAILWLATRPFDKGCYHVGRLFRLSGPVMGMATPLWRFRTSGVAIENPRHPYVFVANHESFIDIVLISHLPWEMKWLSKAELMRLPILGWNMRMAGDVPVERGTRKSAILAMRECADRLRNRRVSVMIFPEGTRSPTEEMLPFKDGAFRLAVETGCPIVPLVVSGTRDCLQKGSWRFGRAVAEVRVLEPIPVDGLTAADVPALRDRVHDLIRTTRDEMRVRLALEA
jgi:1-acyl-sn-glycerol-3-phosphate acyltransferase